MQVSGGPVMDAHRYAMELWRPICERPTNYALTEVVMYPSNLGNCPPAYDTAESDEEDGGIRYISAGRLGKLGADPTDDALVAMLDAAQDSIRLSLQDLGPLKFLIFNLGKWPEPVMGALARAAARGVDVYIVLSTNRSGKFDDYGNGWKPEDAVKNVGKWLEDRPDEVPAGQRVRDIICDKLHVTTLRPSTDDVWPDGRHFGNHAKFVVVDDEAFYMGSQNLYDANLAEYGLIIDDPDVTDEVLSQYWFPMWEQSKRVAVSGSGAPSCSY
jgi:phosphatidylserine/phosphatidylglycerophosphate/cardiolipin synthase-like enzyme